MLKVDIDHVEPGGLGQSSDLDAAQQPDGHRSHDLVARQLLLDDVAYNLARLHEILSLKRLFWIRQLDRQHHITVALAVNVLRERNRDAAAQRILDDEIERLEVAKWVTANRTLGEVPEGAPDALLRQLALQELPMPGVVTDHRNIRGVALVAGARMGEVVDADAHGVRSTITWALTMLFGSSTDLTASTSRTRGSQAPPAPPGPCMCRARTSKPMAWAALRSWVRPAMRSRTS